MKYQNILLGLFVFLSVTAFGENLISNPSFNHGPMVNLTVGLPPSLAQQIKRTALLNLKPTMDLLPWN